MSSGAGHILDMMNRMKQNRALRNSQRNKFKNNRDAVLGKDSRGPAINNPQVSEEQLLKIKKEIQNKAQRRKNIQSIFLALIALSTILAVYYFLQMMY